MKMLTIVSFHNQYMYNMYYIRLFSCIYDLGYKAILYVFIIVV